MRRPALLFHTGALVLSLSLGAPRLAVARQPGLPRGLALAERVTRDELSRVPAERRRYDWQAALLLHALVSVARWSDDGPLYLAYVRRFFEVWAARQPRVTSPDLAAPALAAAELRELFHLDAGDRAIESTLRFLRGEPRTELGALLHIGRSHRFRAWLPPTRTFTRRALWVDSLAMYALTGAVLARVVGDPALAEFSYRQPLIFARVLQREDGLFKHAYLTTTGDVLPRGDACWLRGHGWALLGMVEILSEMAMSHPLRPELVTRFRRAADAVLAFRDPRGLYPTLLTRDRGHSRAEISGSLIVAFALAKGRRLGLLEEQHLKAAAQTFQGASERVERTRRRALRLKGMSGPTNAAASPSFYAAPFVARDARAPYGVGAFLLLAHELWLGADRVPQRSSREFARE